MEVKGYVGKKIFNSLFLTLLIAPLLPQPRQRYGNPGSGKSLPAIKFRNLCIRSNNTIQSYCGNANNNQPISYTRVLHVEIINPEEEKVLRPQIKLEKGIGQGALDLNSDLGAGWYLIRAYTR